MEEGSPSFVAREKGVRGCAMGLIVLSAAIALMWVLLAGLVGQMAERKSLLCSPLVGFVVVALLPSIGHLTPDAYKQCAHCSNMVKVEEAICPYCHADLYKKSDAEKKAA